MATRRRPEIRQLGSRVRRGGEDAAEAMAAIVHALTTSSGNVAEAARTLGYQREALARLLARLGLDQTARAMRGGRRGGRAPWTETPTAP